MEERDYLKDQIDRMSRLLGDLMARAVGLGNGNPEDKIELIERTMKNALGLEPNKLLSDGISLEKTDNLDLIIRMVRVLEVYIDSADIDSGKKQQYYKNLLRELQNAQLRSGTYSLEQQSLSMSLSEKINDPE